MIKWDVTPRDFKLICQIVDRIEEELPGIQERRVWIMDLNACHVNGCPLQLKELLIANDSDFIHDMLGIRRHINRTTGKLEDCFDPRYGAAEVGVAE